MAFASIGLYDLSTFTAAYVAKHKRGLVESGSPRHHGVRCLDLLNDREPSPAIAEWRSAAALFQKVGASLAALPRPGELVHAYIEALDPGGYTDWNTEDVIDPDCFMRVHVLLQPAPAFRLYSGAETLAPIPWQAYAADHRAPVSQSNFGRGFAAHCLVMELALDVAG